MVDNQLPVEILYQILLYVDRATLPRFCLANSKINDICKADNFWKERAFLDYGFTKNSDPETWTVAYQDYTKFVFKQKYRLVKRFNLYMSQILSGNIPDNVINVNFFDARHFRGARLKSTYGFEHPRKIMHNNQLIAIPIVYGYGDNYQQNYNDFVRVIVKSSAYSYLFE